MRLTLGLDCVLDFSRERSQPVRVLGRATSKAFPARLWVGSRETRGHGVLGFVQGYGSSRLCIALTVVETRLCLHTLIYHFWSRCLASVGAQVQVNRRGLVETGEAVQVAQHPFHSQSHHLSAAAHRAYFGQSLERKRRDPHLQEQRGQIVWDRQGALPCSL